MKLKKYIEENGIRVGDFAARVGVSCDTVYKWMQGERTPRRRMLQIIYSETNGHVEPKEFFEIPGDVAKSAHPPPS